MPESGMSLETSKPGSIPLETVSQVDSTNDAVLRRVAALDRITPLAMRAAVQTAARGRSGRSWQSPGGGLWLSLAWPVRHSQKTYAAVPLLAGLAVRKAIYSLIDVPGSDDSKTIQIKWPNDLLVAGQKLGGILCEMRHSEGSCSDWLVVGIGVNAIQPPGELDPGSLQAVGLEELFGVVPDLSELSTAFLIQMGQLLSDLEESPADTLSAARTEIEPLLAYRGQPIRVSNPYQDAEPVFGVVHGLDDELRLVVSMSDDRLFACEVGEVQHIRLYEEG